MKLKEKVFMCELIKANYRRRMFWFWLQVFALAVCLLGIMSHIFTGANLPTIMAISLIGLVALVVNASRLYMSVFSPGFPWIVKKDQADTLEQIWKEVDFENLRGYVHLNEYTEV